MKRANVSLGSPLRVGGQRWHAGAEGSLAQIAEVSLSCIRYRVTANSTRRIAAARELVPGPNWGGGSAPSVGEVNLTINK
jgi:hypothetical protein